MTRTAKAPAANARANPIREGRGKDPFLQSFAKGLSVISAFGHDTRTMTL